MALVFRNGRPYLYKSERQGDRVVARYVASGETALLIGKMGQIERQIEEDAAYLDREERKEADRLDRELDDLAGRAKNLAAEALTAAGYHRHHRGDWRKRRGC